MRWFCCLGKDSVRLWRNGYRLCRMVIRLTAERLFAYGKMKDNFHRFARKFTFLLKNNNGEVFVHLFQKVGVTGNRRQHLFAPPIQSRAVFGGGDTRSPAR